MDEQSLRIVVVCGPVGAGKTNVCHGAARALSNPKIPTSVAISSGWYYRLVAYLALHDQIKWEEGFEQDLINHVRARKIALLPNGKGFTVDDRHVDVMNLKTPEISELCSRIAQIESVRRLAEALLMQTLEDLSRTGCRYVIIDGRDPDRNLYQPFPVCLVAYLDVSDTEAARRTGESLEAIQERNLRDTRRLTAARYGADWIMDTTRATEAEVARKLALAIAHTSIKTVATH